MELEDEVGERDPSVRILPGTPNTNNFCRCNSDQVAHQVAFLKSYSGELHGKFMHVSCSVHVGGLPSAIGTNRVYSSGRKKGSTGRADPGLLQEHNMEFTK
jgi:hypothetical protein